MAVVFFAFRIMVGCGLTMLGLVIARLWLRGKGRLFETRWFMTFCMLTSPLGFVAVIAGWTTTEVGRQPWTVYGLMRTTASVSPSLTTLDVALSLAAYVGVYLIMYPAGLFVMARFVRQGPPTASASRIGVIEAGRRQQSVEQFAMGSTEI